FWNSVSVKRSGDVTRLQALVDKKRIVISKAVICEILQLNDVEGVVFANMRRVGKGFSGVETPLLESMLVVRDVAEEEEHVLDTCYALARRVEGLENDKAAQQPEIVKLKAKV
nr:hypothetical protein [Tanacetum cinerariifolium]